MFNSTILRIVARFLELDKLETRNKKRSVNGNVIYVVKRLFPLNLI